MYPIRWTKQEEQYLSSSEILIKFSYTQVKLHYLYLQYIFTNKEKSDNINTYRMNVI